MMCAEDPRLASQDSDDAVFDDLPGDARIQGGKRVIDHVDLLVGIRRPRQGDPRLG
jgi:hypothetical protein